jgi:hypothetical protein
MAGPWASPRHSRRVAPTANMNLGAGRSVKPQSPVIARACEGVVGLAKCRVPLTSADLFLLLIDPVRPLIRTELALVDSTSAWESTAATLLQPSRQWLQQADLGGVERQDADFCSSSCFVVSYITWPTLRHRPRWSPTTHLCRSPMS